jgi:hypothetical protein
MIIPLSLIPEKLLRLKFKVNQALQARYRFRVWLERIYGWILRLNVIKNLMDHLVIIWWRRKELDCFKILMILFNKILIGLVFVYLIAQIIKLVLITLWLEEKLLKFRHSIYLRLLIKNLRQKIWHNLLLTLLSLGYQKCLNISTILLLYFQQSIQLIIEKRKWLVCYLL